MRLTICLSVLLLAFTGMVGPSGAQESGGGTSSGPAAGDPEPERDAGAGVPVRFRGAILFSLDRPIGTRSIEDRAATIERRLSRVAEGDPALLDTLRVVEREDLSEIYIGEVLIKSVTTADSDGSGRTRQQMAADQALAIGEALRQEFRDRSAQALVRAALLALLATLVLVIVLAAVHRVYRRLHRAVAAKATTRAARGDGSPIGWFEPATIIRMAGSSLAVFAWLIGLIAVFIYLEQILALFPWTRGLADKMVATSRSAVATVAGGLVGYLPKLLNIAIILVVARFVLRLLRVAFDRIADGRLALAGFYPEWSKTTYSLARFFVIAIAATMVFPYLPGAGSEGFRGISVFVGLLVSLGAASAVANVIAGVVLTYMRPFRIGDRVRIADALGDVVSANLLLVRVRTSHNVDIAIPNSLVLGNHIINFSTNASSHGLVLHTSVTIGYDVPWRKVHELLVAAARRTPAILADPAPFVLQTALGDYAVAYELNACTGTAHGMAETHSRLHEAIQDVFNEAGVEILSPAYSALRDGNRSTVPQDHLPRNYLAPSFNLFGRWVRGDRNA